LIKKKINRKRHRTSDFRNIKLEKKFVGGILQNADLFRRVIRSFDSNALSSDKLKWIYDKAVNFYNQEGVILDEESFEMILDMNNNKREFYRVLWKSLFTIGKNLKEASVIAAKNKLNRQYQARIIELGMKETLDNLLKAIAGDDSYIDKATSAVLNTAELISIKDTPVIISDPIAKYEEYELFHKRVQKNPEDFLGVPTGIEQLDSRMKGLRNSEFGLITAGTGIGKSIILLDIATHVWITKGDIIYVTIEMPEDQIRQRFYCRLTGIDYAYFRYFELNKEHFKKLNRKMKWARNHEYMFNIIDVAESATVNVIKAEIESLLKKSNNVKAIFIDYLNILRSGSGSGNINLDWKSQIEVAIEIKQKIARYFQLPVWSANQLAGASSGKEFIQISDMAFAKNLPDQTDVNVYIAEMEDTEETGLLKMGFLKTRDFRAESFTVKDNRNKMRFSNYNEKKQVDILVSNNERKIKT